MTEKPIPLIYVGDNGKFVVGEEATTLLQKTPSKIAVVAIAGLYRTGKSFILNRLLGRQSGFDIGATVNSCTKGIYIWGKPQTITNELGEQVQLILMDTEGIGSFEQDQTHDTKIFSLAVLLSSYFIYNSMGVIDEQALEKISFIAQLTKHIHVHSPSGQQDEDEEQRRTLAPYFPNFMWLLRDFGLKLVDPDGNPITTRQYLENALARPSKDKAKNEVRQTVTAVFPNRDCVALVRPVVDEDELQNLDKIPYESLRDKFRVEVESLQKKVLNRLRPKLLFGQPINGSAFVNLVNSYVEAINSGAVPVIRNAWESVSELENKKAVETGIEMYLKYMSEKVPDLPVDQAELYQHNLAGLVQAKESFNLRALGEQRQDYLVQLETKLAEEYDRLVGKNDSASERLCKDLLSKVHEKIEKGLKESSFSSTTDLAHAWRQHVDKDYLPQARGKFKFIVLSEFLLQKMNESMILLDQTQLEALRKQHTAERDQLRSELKEEKDERRKQKEEFAEEKSDLRSQLDKNNKHITTLQEANDAAKVQVATVTAENDKLKKEIADLKKAKEVKQEPRNEETPQLTSNSGGLDPFQKKNNKKSKCVIQ